MNERLKILRKHLNLKQDELGERVKLSRSHISALENGTKKVTDRIIYDICRELDVNEMWLREGKGEMFAENDSTIIEELAREYKLDDLEKKIIEHFVKLDSKHREAIKDYVLSLATEIGNASETAATVEDDIEAEVEKELDIIRQELLDEKKARMLSASTEQKEQKKSG